MEKQTQHSNSTLNVGELVMITLPGGAQVIGIITTVYAENSAVVSYTDACGVRRQKWIFVGERPR